MADSNKFTIVSNGYSIKEVDSVFGLIVSKYKKLEKKNNELEIKLNEALRKLNGSEPVNPGDREQAAQNTAFDADRIAKVAANEAEKIAKKAATEAEKIIKAAANEAERIIKEANAKKEEIIAEAEAELNNKREAVYALKNSVITSRDKLLSVYKEQIRQIESMLEESSLEGEPEPVFEITETTEDPANTEIEAASEQVQETSKDNETTSGVLFNFADIDLANEYAGEDYLEESLESVKKIDEYTDFEITTDVNSLSFVSNEEKPNRKALRKMKRDNKYNNEFRMK